MVGAETSDPSVRSPANRATRSQPDEGPLRVFRTFGGPVNSARMTSVAGRPFGGTSASGAAAVLPVFAVALIHGYRSPKVLGWVMPKGNVG